jgi:phosphoglycerate dehydrogenase-like enzyme
MKRNAYLINTSRGPVVEEEALIEALEKNIIAGAALDVFEKEPPDLNSPLFKMNNVIMTPHIASSTREASRKVFKTAVENVCKVLEGGVPSGEANVVNKAVLNRI